ncbi:NAD(P)-dependent oxidoreductase [Methylobacterium sp. GC_Met_2]|uniref:NAD(P)-dependent oxidoreductase n=1 Tax=Methylobacterium sp. GC_Met_2 TaxID=2937376 RepID=UPI00226B9784|nr:NAD(P)-dependent oxidoreductase [Methylobacterium sp. GC_Met_2]
MRVVFVDANATLAAVARRLLQPDDPPFVIHAEPAIAPQDLPGILAGAAIAVIDHTALPLDVARACTGLKHVVFLGTGARSYMDPEALRAELGVTVHTIKGYGDTAVAECAFALMWAATRGIAQMDRAMRAGSWLRTEGMQLTGKRVGLVGFGGIAAEMARLCQGVGMRVLAWNRTARTHPDVAFVPLERLLAESDVVSLHLLLTDETRGFLSADRIAAMKPGAIVINTARGALIDEPALVEALRTGHIAQAGLDVFTVEPLPADHPLASLPNVTLSAHSAFRTPEASDNLIGAALAHCRRITAG